MGGPNSATGRAADHVIKRNGLSEGRVNVYHEIYIKDERAQLETEIAPTVNYFRYRMVLNVQRSACMASQPFKSELLSYCTLGP